MKFTGSYKPSRLKFHFEIVLGKMLQPSPSTPMDKERPYLRAANVLDGKIDVKDLKVMWFSPKELNIYELKPGDLLVLEGGDVGRCAIWNFEGEIGFQNSLHRLRPFPGNSTRFALYWFKHLKESGYFESISSKATLAHYTSEKVKETPFPDVDFHTQKRIADFLDRETARIDELVEKKQQLVELLEEKRSAVIAKAVTSGLDPTVPMKDSGVEWLCPVPIHWQVWKVTHGFRQLGSGLTPKSDDERYYSGTIPWVTTSELRENYIEDTEKKLTQAAFIDYPGLRIYPVRTLLFAMYGATVGRMGILAVPAAVNQACAAFIGPKTLDPRFTFYWLLMRRPVLVSLSMGGGQPNLSQEHIRQIRIPAPPLAEQHTIVDYLDQETSRIDLVRTKTQQSITRLHELRSALITAAVTGQIDIDEWERRGETDRRLEQLEAGEARPEEAPV